MQKYLHLSTFPTPSLHTLFVLFPVYLWILSTPPLPVRLIIKVYALNAVYILSPLSLPPPLLITWLGVQVTPQILLFMLSLNSLLFQTTSLITPHHPSRSNPIRLVFLHFPSLHFNWFCSLPSALYYPLTYFLIYYFSYHAPLWLTHYILLDCIILTWIQSFWLISLNFELSFSPLYLLIYI